MNPLRRLRRLQPARRPLDELLAPYRRPELDRDAALPLPGLIVNLDDLRPRRPRHAKGGPR